MLISLNCALRRYKMSTSGGGGCCDCGDSEAWKEHPNCALHSRAGAGGSGSGAKGGPGQHVASADLLARIPDEVLARARLVFRSVLKVGQGFLLVARYDHGGQRMMIVYWRGLKCGSN